MPIFQVNIYTCTNLKDNIEILIADNSFKQIIVFKEVIHIIAVNEMPLFKKKRNIRVH